MESKLGSRESRVSAAPNDLGEALLWNLRNRQAKHPRYATRNDWYMALAFTVRDRTDVAQPRSAVLLAANLQTAI